MPENAPNNSQQQPESLMTAFGLLFAGSLGIRVSAKLFGIDLPEVLPPHIADNFGESANPAEVISVIGLTARALYLHHKGRL